MTRSLASLLFVLTACHPATPAPAATAAAAPADRHAAIVADLVGVWHGTAKGTPFGDFPLAITFDPTPEHAVHGRIDDGHGMTLDFTFRDGKLVEIGTIPKLGTQQHELAPAGAQQWTDGAVDVDLALTGDALVWTTRVRGTPHAVFELQRATGEQADQIRAAIAARLAAK